MVYTFIFLSSSLLSKFFFSLLSIFTLYRLQARSRLKENFPKEHVLRRGKFFTTTRLAFSTCTHMELLSRSLNLSLCYWFNSYLLSLFMLLLLSHCSLNLCYAAVALLFLRYFYCYISL
jgi:hypothetical protein